MKRILSIENIIYVALFFTFIVFTFSVITGQLSISFSAIVYIAIIFLLSFGGLLIFKKRIEEESERAQELQASRILNITQTTLPYLRQGLDIGTATKVAEAVLRETKAISVAITDTNRVLVFVGKGSDHHLTGQKIQTEATQQAIKTGREKIVTRKDEIGCPEKRCPLKAAIVVPLKMGGRVIGSLKLYYGKEGKINPSDIALAKGLAHLFEVQLELSQISRLEVLACEAELKALQSQINPHFFFNVLNTAVSYCRRDPQEARKILLDFANFFRATIEHGQEPLITLDSELALIRNYVELEQSRFEDRLIVNDLVSGKARTWKIPPFTLQPIVENAIQHAFVPGRPLVIDIKDYSTPDLHIIEVRDNGRGIPRDQLPTVLLRGKGEGMGVGLSLVHERIKLLYGEEYGLSVESQEGKGTKIRVIMPAATKISSTYRLPL